MIADKVIRPHNSSKISMYLVWYSVHIVRQVHRMVSNKQIIKCKTRVVIFSKRRTHGGAELEVAGGELAGLKRFIWQCWGLRALQRHCVRLWRYDYLNPLCDGMVFSFFEVLFLSSYRGYGWLPLILPLTFLVCGCRKNKVRICERILLFPPVKAVPV